MSIIKSSIGLRGEYAINLYDKQIDFTIKQETIICLAMSLLISNTWIVSLFNGIIRRLFTLPDKLDTLLIYGVFFIIIMFAFRTVFTRFSRFVFIVVLFVVSGYLFAFLSNIQYYDYYIKLGIDILFFSIPWALIAFAVRDSKICKKYLTISTYIILISVVANIFIFKNEIFKIDHYDQSYTYALLSVSVIACNKLFEKINIYRVGYFVLSLVFMISMGARGPLLALALFIMLRVMVILKDKPKIIVLLIIFAVLIIIPVYALFDQILYDFLELFQRMNLSPRIIIELLNGSFFTDNARWLLFEHSVDIIVEHPFLGVGVGNDRILLADKMGYSILEAVGWYPHNIFLELLLHFGIFIGGAIIIFLFKVFYTTIFKNKDKDAVDIICIFMGIGFFPLFVSGSYVSSPLFFALIGYCLYEYKKIKLIKKGESKWIILKDAIDA